MRKSVVVGLSGVGLFAIVAAASAGTDWEITAQVPFAFEVADTTLPAGAYTIEPQGILEPSVFVIRSADDGTAVAFIANETTPSNRLTSAEMAFDRYGNREFLRGIFVPGGRSLEIPASSTQSRVEKEAALTAERHALAVQHHALKKAGARR
jgi:hypothetical protein